MAPIVGKYKHFGIADTSLYSFSTHYEGYESLILNVLLHHGKLSIKGYLINILREKSMLF